MDISLIYYIGEAILIYYICIYIYATPPHVPTLFGLETLEHGYLPYIIYTYTVTIMIP